MLEDDDYFEVIKSPFDEAEERRTEWLKKRWGKFTSSQCHRLLASGSADVQGIVDGDKGAYWLRINEQERGFFSGTNHEFRTKKEATDWLSQYRAQVGARMLSTGAKTYCEEVLVQRLTVFSESDSYVSEHMQRGIDRELDAIAAFGKLHGDVYATGDDQVFLESPCGWVGGTPDGLMDYPVKAIVEAKAPKETTHFQYLRIKNGDGLKKTEPAYYWQMQRNMDLFGADCAGGWFISFDDRFIDESKHLHVVWIERNQIDIDFAKSKEELAIRWIKSQPDYVSSGA